jgi:hypothetical protein
MDANKTVTVYSPNFDRMFEEMTLQQMRAFLAQELAEATVWVDGRGWVRPEEAEAA